MTAVFTPQRLTVARQKHGLTKGKLAEMLGVTARSITYWESGEVIPSEENIAALAEALKFPVSFFSQPECDQPQVHGVSFRALKSITAAQRDAALASGALAMEVAAWIEASFVLPEPDVPDYRNYPPDSAAAALRLYWGLGERPIPNCIHLLESKGVRVFSLVEMCRQLDAYSFWRGDVPFVFLNTIKSSEKSRFDAMHELGHLVLHRFHGITRSRETEQEADAFASAMLMPASDVIARAPRTPTLPHIIEAKKRWNVSAAAFAYRMHSLKLISDWHYRTLCIQMSERGYRTNEPQSGPRETSQVLKKVFALSREDGVTRAAVAGALHLNVADLDSLIFGLVMTGIGGGRSGEATSPSQAPALRLVQPAAED